MTGEGDPLITAGSGFGRAMAAPIGAFSWTAKPAVPRERPRPAEGTGTGTGTPPSPGESPRRGWERGARQPSPFPAAGSRGVRRAGRATGGLCSRSRGGGLPRRPPPSPRGRSGAGTDAGVVGRRAAKSLNLKNDLEQHGAAGPGPAGGKRNLFLFLFNFILIL